MANIRIKDLPADGAPKQTDLIPIDLGSTRHATVKAVVESGRPTASKTEAEVGVDPQKAMTPLTTKQAIDAQVGATYVPKTVKVNAGSGMTGGGALSGDVTVGLTVENVDRLTKVDGIEAGATKNQSDAHLLARANHTGTQAISTVSGLQTALDGKLPVDGVAADSYKLGGETAQEWADKINVGGIYDTKAILEAANVPVSVNAVRLNGWGSIGDGEDGLFVDIDNGSPDTATSMDGRTWYRVKSASEFSKGYFVDSKFQFGKKYWQANSSEIYSVPDGDIVRDEEGLSLTLTSDSTFYSRSLIPVDTSRVYSIRFRAKKIVDGGVFSAGVRCFDKDGVSIGTAGVRYITSGSNTLAVADGMKEFSGYLTGESAAAITGGMSFAVGTRYVRIIVRPMQGAPVGAEVKVFEVSGLEDVTSIFEGERATVNYPAVLKNRKSWPISAFGRAVGVGVEANDTAAMNKMIAEGELNITLDVPVLNLSQGRYALNQNTSIVGQGRASTIKVNDPNQSVALLRIASGVSLKSFNIRAPQDTVSEVLVGQSGIDTGDTGLDIEGVRFENLDIQGFRWYGITGHRMKNMRSRGVAQRNIGRAGWIMVGGKDCVHYGDTVKNVGPGSGGNAPLINAYGFNYGNDGAATGFPVPKDIYFINCGVEDIPTWTAFDSHGSDNFNVINCWTRRVCNPIYLGPSSGTNEDGSFNWSVIGGSFIADGTPYRRGGIIATWKTGSIGGMGGRIIGPTLDGYGLNPALAAASSLTLEGAIHLAYQSGVVIDSPNIRNFNQSGILFRRDVTDTILRGHNIVNGVETLGRTDAILVAEAQNTSVVIHPGYIRRSTGAQIRGVVSEGSATTSFYGARVHGQDMVGVATPYVKTVPFIAPGPNP